MPVLQGYQPLPAILCQPFDNTGNFSLCRRKFAPTSTAYPERMKLLERSTGRKRKAALTRLGVGCLFR